MKIEGVVKAIMDMKVFDSGFMLQEMVVETKDQYPQPLLVQFTKEKTSLLNDLTEGMEVSVSINLRGREWTSPKGEVKYFNTIEGWKLEVLSEQPKASVTPPQPPAQEAVRIPAIDDAEDDQLPF
jgi:hypothetical protein